MAPQIDEIIQALRGEHSSDVGRWHLANRAADAIRDQEAEIVRLRAALTSIANGSDDESMSHFDYRLKVSEIADAALVGGLCTWCGSLTPCGGSECGYSTSKRKPSGELAEAVEIISGLVILERGSGEKALAFLKRYGAVSESAVKP